jgi:hypothetical protein
MQSGATPAMQTGHVSDCLARAPGQPTGEAMGETVLGVGNPTPHRIAPTIGPNLELLEQQKTPAGSHPQAFDANYFTKHQADVELGAHGLCLMFRDSVVVSTPLARSTT